MFVCVDMPCITEMAVDKMRWYQHVHSFFNGKPTKWDRKTVIIPYLRSVLFILTTIIMHFESPTCISFKGSKGLWSHFLNMPQLCKLYFLNVCKKYLSISMPVCCGGVRYYVTDFKPSIRGGMVQVVIT